MNDAIYPIVGLGLVALVIATAILCVLSDLARGRRASEGFLVAGWRGERGEVGR